MRRHSPSSMCASSSHASQLEVDLAELVPGGLTGRRMNDQLADERSLSAATGDEGVDLLPLVVGEHGLGLAGPVDPGVPVVEDTTAFVQRDLAAVGVVVMRLPE